MWRNARKTIYAITSKRVLVIRGTFFKGLDVLTYPPADLESVSRKERADGSGDLFLYGWSGPGATDLPHNLIGIPDVRNVEQILCKMRDENLAEKQ
jgi:hypothetical protein